MFDHFLGFNLLRCFSRSQHIGLLVYMVYWLFFGPMQHFLKTLIRNVLILFVLVLIRIHCMSLPCGSVKHEEGVSGAQH